MKRSTAKALGVLTDKQEKFCRCYAFSLHVPNAAKEAGYAPGSGYNLMRRREILERISEIQTDGAKRMVADQNSVIREATYLAYSDITEVMACDSLETLQALPERVRRAIKSITRDDYFGPDGKINHTRYRFTMHEKIEVLKLLALITKAIDPNSREAKESPPFSGFTIITRQLPAPGGKASGN